MRLRLDKAKVLAFGLVVYAAEVESAPWRIAPAACESQRIAGAIRSLDGWNGCDDGGLRAGNWVKGISNP